MYKMCTCVLLWLDKDCFTHIHQGYHSEATLLDTGKCRTENITTMKRVHLMGFTAESQYQCVICEKGRQDKTLTRRNMPFCF